MAPSPPSPPPPTPPPPLSAVGGRAGHLCSRRATLEERKAHFIPLQLIRFPNQKGKAREGGVIGIHNLILQIFEIHILGTQKISQLPVG